MKNFANVRTDAALSVLQSQRDQAQLQATQYAAAAAEWQARYNDLESNVVTGLVALIKTLGGTDDQLKDILDEDMLVKMPMSLATEPTVIDQ